MPRSVVVTGGSRGVGAAIARALAADSWRVIVLDQDDTGTHETVVGDAGDLAVAERAAELAGDSLAGWVNNAAVFRDADLHVAPELISETIGANLRPAVTGTALAVRAFLATGAAGSVVNVSSHQATRPVPGALAYATAKAAIEGLTRAAAVDYGHRGIRVNAVALGTVRTARFDAEFEPVLAPLHALGRIGEGSDVADVVAFLLSDAARFITGAVIPVDGGRHVLGADAETRYPV